MSNAALILVYIGAIIGLVMIIGIIRSEIQERNKPNEEKIDDLLYRIDKEKAIIESLKRQIKQLEK